MHVTFVNDALLVEDISVLVKLNYLRWYIVVFSSFCVVTTTMIAFVTVAFLSLSPLMYYFQWLLKVTSA